MSAYVAVKHVVCGLTEAMTVEGKPLGIYINYIASSTIDTDLVKIAEIEYDTTMTPCLIAKIVTEFSDQKSLGRSTGKIDTTIGMVTKLIVVKKIEEKDIIDRFDHNNLNKDCSEFKKLVPQQRKYQ